MDFGRIGKNRSIFYLESDMNTVQMNFTFIQEINLDCPVFQAL